MVLSLGLTLANGHIGQVFLRRLKSFKLDGLKDIWNEMTN